MSTQNTGGPAFPSGLIDPSTPDDAVQSLHKGMTLRDYAAIKVLAGFAANPAIFAANGMTGWGLVNCTEEQLCQSALCIADAMLKARTA